MIKKINLIGGGFQHVPCSTLNKIPKYIEWDYSSTKNDITFYVDDHIKFGLMHRHDGKKFGWLLESKFVTPNIVEFCFNNIEILKNEYQLIFTHNDDLIDKDPSFFKFTPANGTWIKNISIRKKTKLISMICSDKSFTEGHKNRLKIAKNFSEKLDLFGRGFKEIEEKEQGLDDYMFSICMENGNYDTYFTEKILDCFATGTIPIYWGTKKIVDFFDPEGIIFLNEDDFDIEKLSKEIYFQKKKSILNNLEIVKNFSNVEDWMFLTYLKNLL